MVHLMPAPHLSATLVGFIVQGQMQLDFMQPILSDHSFLPLRIRYQRPPVDDGVYPLLTRPIFLLQSARSRDQPSAGEPKLVPNPQGRGVIRVDEVEDGREVSELWREVKV